MKTFLRLCLLALVLLAPAAYAKRVALIIGNANYQSEKPLKNPINDVRLLEGVFRNDLKFDVVIKVENGSIDKLDNAVDQFVREARGAEAAVFYFSGHGMQDDSKRNYLIPVDARIDSLNDLKRKSLSADDLMQRMADAQSHISLIILDACRDNPFSAGSKSGNKGLARMADAALGDGMLIAYTTRDGQVAQDGDGTNSPYAAALANNLRNTSQPVLVAFDNVANSVRQATNGTQRPTRYGDLPAMAYLVPSDSTGTQPPIQVASLVPVPAKPASRPAPKVSSDPDSALWQAVENGNTADDYDVYLNQYPKGKYVALARSRLQKLKDDARQQAEAAEQSAWQAAESAQTVEAYAAYTRSYPTGRYTALAQTRSNKLRQDAAVQEEARLWQAAERGGKTEVDAYLAGYPSGRYASAANLRLAQIKKEEAEMRPGKAFKDCPECPEVVILPAGSFQMGSSSSEAVRYDDEGPVHTVAIARPFAIGKTAVTQGQWKAIMGSNPSHFSSCGDSCPVETVSWNDAQDYVKKLNEKTGKTYRLPSEAEWEYACRAGGQQLYCGSDNIDSVAWYGNNGQAGGNSSQTTHAVATKQANAWGLYDMSGNVWQWTADCFNASYAGAPTDGNAWNIGDCSWRVLRGGSWFVNPLIARSATRFKFPPGLRNFGGGFRVARMLP